MATIASPKTTITQNGRLEEFVPSSLRRRPALRAECSCGWHSNPYRAKETVELVRAAHENTCLEAMAHKLGVGLRRLLVNA